MKKLIKNWKEMLPYERVFRILCMVMAIPVIIFAVLNILDVTPAMLQHIFMGLLLLCQAVCIWREQRGVAIFSICGGCFVLTVALLTLLLL